LNNKTFHILLEDPFALTRGSTWNTRGWTFQEALLSRRRDLFTDSEVYFECWGMVCRDSINTPLEELHTKDLRRFKKTDSTGIKGTFPFGVGDYAVAVFDRIREYRARSFSFESDVLDGFLDILHSFKRQFDVDHCWGVPLVPHPIAWLHNGKQTEVTPWSYDRRFCLGIFSFGPGESRRAGFPSWSWTGWHWEITKNDWMEQDSQWTPSAWEFRVNALDHALEANIEMKNGEILPIKHYALSSKRHPELSSFIHIKLWQCPVNIQVLKRMISYPGGCAEVWTGLDDTRGKLITTLGLDRLRKLIQNEGEESFDARIVFCFSPDTFYSGGIGYFQLWLVVRLPGGWYERVLELQLSSAWSDDKTQCRALAENHFFE
jgi:hypothetical protein